MVSDLTVLRLYFSASQMRPADSRWKKLDPVGPLPECLKFVVIENTYEIPSHGRDGPPEGLEDFCLLVREDMYVGYWRQITCLILQRYESW